MKINASLCRMGAAGALLLCATPTLAQTTKTAQNVANQAAATTNAAVSQVPNTVTSVGNTANGLVGGLQPTLQPVTQGAGAALNNLTQPDNISALLEFLSSVVPNHIEAHVNRDALRVEKLTVDVRGVDLRNLKIDILVANSRNAGQVRPALQPAGSTGTQPATNAPAATGQNANTANANR